MKEFCRQMKGFYRGETVVAIIIGIFVGLALCALLGCKAKVTLSQEDPNKKTNEFICTKLDIPESTGHGVFLMTCKEVTLPDEQ